MCFFDQPRSTFVTAFLDFAEHGIYILIAGLAVFVLQQLDKMVHQRSSSFDGAVATLASNWFELMELALAWLRDRGLTPSLTNLV